MSTELAEKPKATTVILYTVTEETIAERRNELLTLRINGIEDKEGLANVKAKLKEVIGWRTSVEKTRTEAKAEFLEAGRRVDAQAKALQELIAPIEKHLAGQKKLVDDELARIEKQKADEIYAARLKRLQAAGAEIPEETVRAMTEPVFEAALERAAEQARTRKEQEAAARVERDRLRKEREELEAERARLAEERRAVENQRIANERAARAAEERERERQLDAQLAERREKERQEQEAARVAAEARREELKPVLEKLKDFADKIRMTPLPKLDDEICAEIDSALYACADRIEAIGKGLIGNV